MTTVLTAREVTAGYGELVLVELPAMDCFAALGWEVANLYDETFGVDGTEGRKSSAEIILVPRLRRALERINPGYPATAYEQAIEQLSDIALQIQLGIQKLWDKITPAETITPWLSLTQIEELAFWRLKPEHAGIGVMDAICLAKHFLHNGGFFNNMQGEGTWLFDADRRPVSLGTDLTRDLFFALRPVLAIHQLDFDSSCLTNFRTDDESFPGHLFLAGELSVWGLKGQPPRFITEARLDAMELDDPFANLPDDDTFA